MIRGIGIDLLETERMARALSRHGERFERRVFTEVEREQCRTRADRVLALAARFAAKEACLKALGTGWSGGLGLTEVEVVRQPDGKPVLQLHGAVAEHARRLAVSRVHVSLTHQAGMAGAVVVLEGSPD